MLILTGSAIGLAGSAVIIAFMINAINTLYSHEICRAWFSYARGWRWFFWVREGLPRPNAFISSWMAWFAHILMLEVYFDLV
jgi:hypothetical protein